MNYYEKQKTAEYAKWEQATDNNDECGIAKHMTEYLNYCKFIDQPEIQARAR